MPKRHKENLASKHKSKIPKYFTKATPTPPGLSNHAAQTADDNAAALTQGHQVAIVFQHHTPVQMLLSSIQQPPLFAGKMHKDIRE